MMRTVQLHNARSILCLGAHADDIEIGCGGALLQWLASREDVEVTWVVLSAAGERRDEAIRSAEAFLEGCSRRRILVEDFTDAYFPSQWEAIKDKFRELASSVTPDLVFTHRLEDRHQDHRVVAELTWNHFRRQLILEYEIPKFEGDLTTPNTYIALDESNARRKLDLLNTHFATQQAKYWYSESTFDALMRIRGLEAGCDTGLAEGFHARKLVVSFDHP